MFISGIQFYIVAYGVVLLYILSKLRETYVHQQFEKLIKEEPAIFFSTRVSFNYMFTTFLCFMFISGIQLYMIAYAVVLFYILSKLSKICVHQQFGKVIKKELVILFSARVIVD